MLSTSITPTGWHLEISAQARQALEDACAKYEMLVKFARNGTKLNPNSLIIDAAARKRFPQEVKNLVSSESVSDFQHGYDSGMLAAFRLTLGLLLEHEDSVTRIEKDVYLDPESYIYTDSLEEPGEPEATKSILDTYPNLDT